MAKINLYESQINTCLDNPNTQEQQLISPDGQKITAEMQ